MPPSARSSSRPSLASRASPSRPSSRPSDSQSTAMDGSLTCRPASGRLLTVEVVIAMVEPLTPARALRGPFDYRLGSGHGAVEVGAVLVVPFGRRRLLGVVVDLAESSEVPEERLVEPLAALDGDVPPELVELGLWVANQYCSTPARGLSLVLPPGTGTGSRRRVGPRRTLVARLTEIGATALEREGGGPLGVRQRAALEALADGPMEASALGRSAGCDHGTLRRLERRGLVAIGEVVRRGSAPRVEGGGGRSGGAPPPPARGGPPAAEGARLVAGGGRPPLPPGGP